MIDLVEEGIELAIRAIPPPDSSLITRRLVAWRHILCATPAYLERHGVPARLEDLQHHNCLRFLFYPFGDEWRFTDRPGRPGRCGSTAI